MIKIKNLTKLYGNIKIVDDLSLEINHGAIFGFLGPNGAGKTTAMKMIVGLSSPDSGRIEIDNKEVKTNHSKEQIGFMPEDPYFYEHLTAKEFLEFMGSLFSPVRCLPEPQKCHSELIPELHNKKISKPCLPAGKQVRDGNIDDLLDLVGLTDVKKKKIRQFSKGMKQRLGLAQAIINDPNYIFLDEPLDGLDPIGRREFKQIILNLKKEGKTIFFNSHILSDVEEICDQIGIINRGKLIYSGDVKTFRKNKSLEDAFVERITNE